MFTEALMMMKSVAEWAPAYLEFSNTCVVGMEEGRRWRDVIKL